MKRSIFVRTIALPTDHGSWVFLFGPLLTGMAAGGRLSAVSFWLILGAVSGFLLRQPVTVMVKAVSGRRRPEDGAIARIWVLLYTLPGLVSGLALALQGFWYLLLLVVPAIPVFVWHLWLVSRRKERRQPGVEIVGAGVLALAAPAAYWVGCAAPEPFGWWLWGLNWLQAASSIVYAYLRLEQRQWSELPPPAARLRLAWRALLYTTFNLLFVSAFSLGGVLSPLLPVAFAVQWLETIWGALHPAIGWKPTAIGFRQLAVSVAFTLLFILAL